MLKHGDTRFLDDMTLTELQQKLDVAIAVIEGGAANLVEKITDYCCGQDDLLQVATCQPKHQQRL
jgi:NifB/MoaA-like Fe-S oxidoreductase